MLVTKGVAGFSGIDVLVATVSMIYRLAIKDAAGKGCRDIEPGFNWYSIRIDGVFGGSGQGEAEFDMA